MSRCAACGLPGHRFGRNEGMERFDPMACINQLRGELERSRTVDYEAAWTAFEKGILTKGLDWPDIVPRIVNAALGDTGE